RQEGAFGRKLIDGAGQLVILIETVDGLPDGPALGDGDRIAQRIAQRQFLEDIGHAGAGGNVEISRLDDGRFLNAAAELGEDKGVGDEALLFETRGRGGERVARFDAEDAILAHGAVAVILGGYIKEPSAD